MPKCFQVKASMWGLPLWGKHLGEGVVCVWGEEVGEEADTLEEKMTLQKSHLGAFHMAPGSPMAPPWW